MKYKTHEYTDTPFINFVVEEKFRLWRHLVFVTFFLVLLYFASFWRMYEENSRYYVLGIVYFFLLVMAYINMYVLVPKLFFKTFYVPYFIFLVALGVLGLNVISSALSYFYEDRIIPYQKGGLYEGVIMCISIILITTTVKLVQKWTRDNERILELNDLTLTMELKELRNQINPHFLFNMLNNVKALIRTDPEKASTVIIKLSEFLRYQLYENNEEKTLLTSEIEFLSNFINLEKIRRENFSVEIKSETDKKKLNTIFIPPNLFTTFVENAIKHSVEIDDNPSFVDINIEIKDKHLLFVCTNSRNPNYSISNGNYGGLGLANIKRRLELLYQDRFDLKIYSANQEYTVNLSIPV